MKEKIKDYIYQDGKLVHQKLQDRIFLKKFPDFKRNSKLKLINDVWLFLNETTHKKQKCKNCGNQTKFKNFNEGYRTFCSNQCVNEYNSKSKKFSEKISEKRKSKYNDEYYIEKYGYPKRNGKFLYHGKLIDRNKLLRILNTGFIDKKEYFIENWNRFKHKTSEDWVEIYFPNVYQDIIERYENTDYSFQTKKYLYINDMDNAPICPVCNQNETTFVYSSFAFSKTCNSINCRNSSSEQEREIYQFLSGCIDTKLINNYRIENNEIDIYLPEFNLGIEFNGLYWHSELYKEKDYHYKKKEFFKREGIDIFYIWEDDWLSNKELLQSMILNKLGKSKRLFARKCTINKVKYNDAVMFHNQNHLNGYSIAKTHVGLYHKNELVALSSFGKSRYEKNGIELVRFSVKSGFSVIGGFSKILKFYLREFKPSKIISYADYDFSNGNVYQKTGFKLIKHTCFGFFWIKGMERYSRQSLWKLTKNKKNPDSYLRELGYTKIWNSGNLKFVLENEYINKITK